MQIKKENKRRRRYIFSHNTVYTSFFEAQEGRGEAASMGRVIHTLPGQA